MPAPIVTAIIAAAGASQKATQARKQAEQANRRNTFSIFTAPNDRQNIGVGDSQPFNTLAQGFAAFDQGRKEEALQAAQLRNQQNLLNQAEQQQALNLTSGLGQGVQLTEEQLEFIRNSPGTGVADGAVRLGSNFAR